MPVSWFISLALSWSAQQAAPAREAPVFRTETTLALVRFNVLRKHRYADDLKAEDVILLEDGLPRKFTVFEGGRLTPRTIPIETILLFDTSGSVTSAGLLDPLAYKTTLLDNLPSVRLSVYSFTSTLHRHCRPTRDPEALTAALGRVRQFRSGADDAQSEKIALHLPPGRKGEPETWLFEAIMAASRDAAGDRNPATRMVVVFSDGLATTNTRPEDAATALSELGIPVYPVVLGHADLVARKVNDEDNLGLPQLKEMSMADFARMADLTGGRSFDPPTIDVAIVRQILGVLAGQALFEYVVGFQPDHSSGEPQRHKLTVKLRSKDLGTVRGGVRTVMH